MDFIKNQILPVVDRLIPSYIGLWEELYTLESPSDCKQALDQVVARIHAICTQKGDTTTKAKFEAAENFLRINLA